PYEAPFISDTLKKVTKFKSDVETYNIQKLKTNEKAIQKLRDLLNKEL
ncbi:8694_t:CDS:2, partial [Gigaspora rosea]